MQSSYNSYLCQQTHLTKIRASTLPNFIKVSPLNPNNRFSGYGGKKAEPKETGSGNCCKRNNESRRD